MYNINIEDCNLSKYNGLLEDLIITFDYKGETYYLNVVGYLDLDDVDFDVDYQHREPDVGIDYEGYYVEDYEINDIKIDNMFIEDEYSNDITSQYSWFESIKKDLMEEVKDTIIDYIYNNESDTMEEMLLEKYENENVPDFDDYYYDD